MFNLIFIASQMTLFLFYKITELGWNRFASISDDFLCQSVAITGQTR